MASKQFARIESDICTNRIICNWEKAYELIQQVSKASNSLESLSKLLLGEKKLEEHLDANPPNEVNVNKARTDLEDAKKSLKAALDGTLQGTFQLEVKLLLGKLLHAQGSYDEALNMIKSANIDNISLGKHSNRTVRLVAEAYAVKGLCLEKLTSKDSSKRLAPDCEIIECYEKAGDISIVQLQQRDKILKKNLTMGSNVSESFNSSQQGQIGSVLEIAIQRSSIIHIQNGDLLAGIGRFRELLTAVETRSTQNLRLTLARQLSEVLLRGTCNYNYTLPSNHRLGKLKDKQQPERYSTNSSFVPKTREDETLLLLLIAEALASREAVLERTPSFEEARKHSFDNTTAVYDLLTLVLVRRAQYDVLCDFFEKALKFSFKECHIWYQLGLSLMSSGKHHRALQVLRECVKLDPQHATAALLAARLCFEHLHLLEEGIEFSENVINLGEDHPQAGRGFLAQGIGYSLQATETKTQTQRQSLHHKALQSFQRSYDIDSDDHLTLYHMSLQCSLLRRVNEAMCYVQDALQLSSQHQHSLHLLALLLSAQKKYKEALEVIQVAVTEYPDNFSLLFTKSRLEERVLSVEQALSTCKKMLDLWKSLYDTDSDGETRGTGLIDKLISDRRSLAQITLSEYGDKDSARGSVRESLAASRVEQALSDVASSMNSSYAPNQGQNQAWFLQAQLWIHLGEFYLNMEKLNEASACVKESATIFPLSHQVAYMKGRISELKMDYSEAREHYLNAIAINPAHIKSLQHLGQVHHCLGNDLMAEKVLRDAVNIDPSSSQTWHDLGKVLESIGEFEAASECLITAVSLDTTSPIMPFSILPRILQS